MGELDHVVINALRETDAAEALFRNLGFMLTPRGHHTLGSVNHLMMTPGPYLEIVGVPSEGRQRKELLDSPPGLNGVVIRTQDTEATFARLSAEGFGPLPPREFSRPVDLGAATAEARFRTVRLPPQAFSPGRLYFCHHLTPELVWRPDWFDHANGFRTIDRIEVECPDPAEEAERLARIVEGRVACSEDFWRVTLEDAEIVLRPGSAPRLVAVGLCFDDLARLEERARKLREIEWTAQGPREAMVRIPSLPITLICGSAG